MALRTFRQNPSLGGFGGESNKQQDDDSDGDAFAQILKELVDNAVDACRSGELSETGGESLSLSNDQQKTKKRVRVTIEPEALDDKELLRVTVVDNGRGMANIQACVDPFYSSKRQSNNNDDDEQSRDNHRNSGRYGIGLTLCLLHAQRLVPGSSASIRSATVDQAHWTHVTCVVDTDNVRCVRPKHSRKSSPDESGTAISILIPSGPSTRSSWPRLAEYFARFRLSMDLPCSLEVRAPTLSTVPLWIRPSAEESASKFEHPKSKPFKDLFAPDLSSGEKSESSIKKNASPERLFMQRAAQLYFARTIQLEHVAHSKVPVRLNNNSHPADGPMLEMFMLVHGLDDDDAEEDEEEKTDSEDRESDESGKLLVVRMVNGVPLLDSTEALMCGLVQGLAYMTQVWNSFGLEVTLKPRRADPMKLAVFHVRDSAQVAPFFEQHGHALFENDISDNESVDSGTASDSPPGDDDSFDSEIGHNQNRRKRSRKQPRQSLLPAKARLSHILMIVQLHAKPSDLPLPTLSKGRLPVGNSPIDTALELGLCQCLRQLQAQSPHLLLTAKQLRFAERDSRFVPAVAMAMTSILCRSQGRRDKIIGIIKGWEADTATSAHQNNESRTEDESLVARSLQGRLRSLLQVKVRPKEARARATKDDNSTAPSATQNSMRSLDSLFQDVPGRDTATHDDEYRDMQDLDDW